METRQRTMWSVAAILAAVVAVLAVTLGVLRAQDGRPRADAGDVFDAGYQEEPVALRGQVLLPWGRVQVGADDPRAELPDILGAAPTVRAPEGGSFIRVEVELEDDYAIPLATVRPDYTQETDVVLRAGDRDYPLMVPGGLVLGPDEPYFEAGGDFWVAVEGEPTDLEVRVTVDGVTQVVDASDGSVDAGRAADLADLPAPDRLRQSTVTPCGKPQRLDDSGIIVTYRPQLECRVNFALRTPYVDGIGWAASGREFLVVQVVRPSRLSLASVAGPSWEGRPRFSARLGDADPVVPPATVSSLHQDGLTFQDPDDPDQLVFAVGKGEPLGDLDLALVVEATRGAPFVKERRELRFHWTIPGGELG